MAKNSHMRSNLNGTKNTEKLQVYSECNLPLTELPKLPKMKACKETHLNKKEFGAINKKTCACKCKDIYIDT